MSYYCGFHRLPMFMRLIISFFVLLFIVRSPAIAEAISDQGESLFELPRGEDMLQMAGYGTERLSTVLVMGSVLCEACGVSQRISWPLSGATVAVKCQNQEKELSLNSAQGTTDEYGDFTIDLPSHLHAISDLENKCFVQLLRVPNDSPCQPAHVRKQTRMKFSSVGNGIRTYSTGDIKLFHTNVKPSTECDQMESSNRKI